MFFSSGIYGVKFSPNGEDIAFGSEDGTVGIWHWARGGGVVCLDGHESWVPSVAWSPKTCRLVSGSQDETVRIWDTEKNVQFACHKGHKGSVYCVDFSPNGNRVVSGAADGTVRVWDAARQCSVARLRGHTGIIDPVVFSKDGSRLVSAARDATVHIWDAATGEQLTCLRGHENFLYCVGISPDGRDVAFLRPTGDAISVWSSSEGRELFPLETKRCQERSRSGRLVQKQYGENQAQSHISHDVGTFWLNVILRPAASSCPTGGIADRLTNHRLSMVSL